jgi:DNA-binding NarL/FixJ family response regulator
VILSSYRDPRLTGRKLPELPAGAIYLDKAKIDNAESLVQTIVTSMNSQADPDKSENLDNEIKLNDSEIELLKYLWQGLSNSEIARIRNVTGKSAETAISRIAKKCGIKHSSEVNQRILLAKFYQELTGKTT